MLLLFGCAEPTIAETLAAAPTAEGGFDNFSGEALGFLVDADQDITVVVALQYPTGQAQMDFVAEGNAATIASAYTPEVSDALTEAASEWPILAGLVTDGAGVRALPEAMVVLLARGDPLADAPESLWVAVEGSAVLARTDAARDDFQARLRFEEVTGLGAGARRVDPTTQLEVMALDIRIPGEGTD